MSSLALPTAAKKPSGLALPGSTPQPATQPSTPATQQRPIASAGNNSRIGGDHTRGSASPSPEPEDDADGEGDDDDEEHKKPKSSKKKKTTASAGLGVDGAGKQEYRYTNEISQMVSASFSMWLLTARCLFSEKCKIHCRKPCAWLRTLSEGRSSRLSLEHDCSPICGRHVILRLRTSFSSFVTIAGK